MKVIRRLVWVLNIAFLLAFFTAVVLQYNDPDPVIWGLAYFGAFLLCWGFLLGRFYYVAGAMVSVTYAAIAIALCRQFSWDPPLIEIELFREAMGLFIAAGWLAILSICSFRSEKLS